MNLQNLDIANTGLMENSEIAEDFSNASARRCRNLLAKYAKAVKKGKANKEARLLNRTLKKCPDVKQSEIDAIDRLAPNGDLQPSDENIPDSTINASIEADKPLPTPKTPSDSMPISERSEQDMPIPEKKILGMKKGVAIPVIIVGGIVLIVGGIFVYRKFIKK